MGLFAWLGIERPKKELAPDDRESLRSLESDMKQLRLEWEETYETVHRQLRKLGKRQKAEDPEPAAESEETQPVDDKDALRRRARAMGYRV